MLTTLNTFLKSHETRTNTQAKAQSEMAHLEDNAFSEYWRQHDGFASIANIAAKLSWHSWPDRETYYQGLSQAHLPVRFAEIEGVSYEQHIAEIGAVPTRYANWHDYFNALVWLAFPQTKSALNDLHMLGRSGETLRGRRRDAATIFDESGAVVITTNVKIIDALKEMRWQDLFVRDRELWQHEAHVLVFGHGVLDKLRAPYIGLTAHTLVVPLSINPLPQYGLSDEFSLVRAEIDSVLAQMIQHNASDWTPRSLMPLPLLGIPGWHVENEDPQFYQNTHYFRSSRQRQ